MLSDADLLLASASPRRRQLLRLAGLEANVQPVDVAEPIHPEESGEAMVRRLSVEKARAAVDRFQAGELVLAADTTVLHQGQILGKPADAKEATDMLLALRQGSHRVITAITIIERSSATQLTAATRTDLAMRDYKEPEVEAYVAGGSPLDKAGGYGIQDEDFMPVDMEQFDGCFTNVMGLPLCTLGQLLAELGYKAERALIEACFRYHRHELQPIGELLNA